MASFCPLIVFLVLAGTTIDVAGREKEPPKIAIVGGGIGGSSSAFFLRDLFGNDIVIDVYEKGEVGGRLATVQMGDKQYEAGGSIIHEKNAYMVNFTQLLGLQTQNPLEGRLALYNGSDITFESSEWSMVTLAKLFWRYGRNIFKLNSFINNLLTKFERIYKHQQDGLAFTTPERLLESMDGDLMAYLHYSLEEILAHEGISQKLINELVLAAMKNNYGQTTDAQAFVGTVSLAGMEGNLWSVKGGNKQIVEGLLKTSKANLIKAKVKQIKLQQIDDNQVFEVMSSDLTRMYDIVVIATPLHDNISDISFTNFPQPITEFKQHYHRTVATFVHGLPHFTQFKYATFHDFPETVLVTSQNLFFNSLGKQQSTESASKSYKDKQQLPIWKVFSPKPLTDTQLESLFASYEDLKIVDWHAAYPHYSSSEVDLPSFRLHTQLYYINTIELAASCMEMMAIAARNTALLAYYDWTGQTEQVDPYVFGEFGRQEL